MAAMRPPRPRTRHQAGNNGAPGIEARLPGETLVLVAAVIALVALGYFMTPVLSPFVLTGAIVYLLWPVRRTPIASRIMWLSVLLFVFWFVTSLLGVLAPFIIAFLIAYLINPLVTVLEQRAIPRWASSLVFILLLVGVVVTAMLFVLPPAAQQFREILSGVTAIANDFARVVRSGKIFDALAELGVPVEEARTLISEQLTPKVEGLLKTLFTGVFGFVSSISTLVLQIINAVIIPFLAFYLLMDFPVVKRRVVDITPQERRPALLTVAERVDAIMGRYFRGAIVVAIIQGTISGTGLWILGVNYALVLGIMTGVLNFIPYVGLLTSLVVSCLVALFSGEPVVIKIVGVIVMYLSQKLLEATVLAPKIIGSQVGLHPVLLILCLMVFGYFLGFVGMLIAVPVTALIMAGVQEWELRRTAQPVRGQV